MADLITDVANMLASNVTNLIQGADSAKQKVSGEDDFSVLMENATSKLSEGNDPGKELASAGNSSKGAVVDKSSTREIKSENDNTKKINPDENSDDRAGVAKKVVDGATKIKDKIKETFGIDDEELNSAMEVLSLSLQDLLNPDKLKDLMMELTGTTDSISLITNAQLYSEVKAVMEYAVAVTTEITSQLGITPQQLGSVIEDDALIAQAMEQYTASDDNQTDESIANVQLEGSSQNEVAAQTEVTVSNPVVVEVNDNSEITQSVTDTVIQSNSITTDANNQTQESTDAVAVEDDEEQPEVMATVPEETSPKVSKTTSDENATKTSETKAVDEKTVVVEEKSEVDSQKGRNEGFENSSRFGKTDRNILRETSNDQTGFAETVTQQTEVNNVGDVVETITKYTSGDANEIVSQVTTSVKVNISADTTSMEMMLHPATLGTVNVQVSSTNGIVTAHIIVQDEAVRAALESQLLTLQETFNEQGHKVEAVEVSIANYDMNKDNGQNNGQNESERQQKESFRVNGARRRINLGMLEEAEEAEGEMSEEELIARDMMARSGNRLDYTV